MQELLISLSINEYIFAFFAVLTIISSFVSIQSSDIKRSVFCFLMASLSVCGIIVLESETILALVLSGIYISISSLFIILSNNQKQTNTLKSEHLIIGILIFFLLLIIYTKSSRIIDKSSTVDTGHYSGVAGITLFMSVIFTYVVYGVISIMKEK